MVGSLIIPVCVNICIPVIPKNVGGSVLLQVPYDQVLEVGGSSGQLWQGGSYRDSPRPGGQCHYGGFSSNTVSKFFLISLININCIKLSTGQASARRFIYIGC